MLKPKTYVTLLTALKFAFLPLLVGALGCAGWSRTESQSVLSAKEIDTRVISGFVVFCDTLDRVVKAIKDHRIRNEEAYLAAGDDVHVYAIVAGKSPLIVVHGKEQALRPPVRFEIFSEFTVALS